MSCDRSAPPPVPRFAVLTLALPNEHHGYVIFDRQTARITDGVYTFLSLALEVAAYNEERGVPTADMTPDAEALGLRFARTHAVR